MKNRKRLWIIIVFLIILFAVNPKTINFLKARTNTNKDEIQILKEVETGYSNQIIYEKLDQNIVKYTEGILICYNMLGEQKWSVNLGIIKPIIKTNSNSVYIIDEGTNQITRINKKGEQIYKKTLNKPYGNISICDDNYISIHHNINGPIQYVTIIDEKGEDVGEISLGEGIITNMTISKKLDRLALSTLGATQGSMENNLLIYDLIGNLISTNQLQNNIILKLFYSEKGNLMIIDEENIISIDKDSDIKFKTEFKNQIKFIGEKGNNYTTVYTEGKGKNSIINAGPNNIIQNIDNKNGKVLAKIIPREEIINLDNYKDSLITNSLRTLFKYNKKGDIELEHLYSRDIIKSFILSDSHIVIITKENIVFVKL